MVLLVAGLAGCVLAVGVELLDWKLKPWLQHRKVWLPQQRDAWSRHWSDAVSVFRDTLVIAGFAAALRALWLHPPLKDHPEYWNAAICLLAPVIVGKVVGDAADFVQWPKIAKLVRGVMGCVWALGALALALALPVRNPDLGIKDAVGYLTLLAAGILGWRLHTTIHKGLVQLWRYTMDDDASAKP